MVIYELDNSIILVPILTQSEDWALFTLSGNDAMLRSSNPHPVRRLGAIDDELTQRSEELLFQSSPSPKTGRYPQ